MSHMILRAGRDGDNAGHMFQVSTSTPVGLAGRMIARTLNWDIDVLGRPIRYRIEAEQLGRLLNDNETLAQAGLFDTCLLIFHSDSLNQPQPDIAADLQKNAYSMDSMADPLKDPTASLQAAAASRPVDPVPTEAPIAPAAPAPNVSASQNQSKSMTIEQVRTSPVAGWRSLDIDIPDAAAVSDNSSGGENSDQSGFVWKKLN